MRIGLDFDNTIVSYDKLFHKVALEQEVIPADLPPNKVAVRDYLRKVGQEPVWTEMQGTVYGARMDEALAYPGVIECLRSFRDAGHVMAIISHKTRHPFVGPQYDLHAAARAWIKHHLNDHGAPLIPEPQVFFELTKEEKWSRIGTFSCAMFLDDLPEILCSAQFPQATARVLFDPEHHHRQDSLPGGEIVHSWHEFNQLLTR